MPKQEAKFKWHWFLDWVPLMVLASALTGAFYFLNLNADLRYTLMIAVWALYGIVSIGVLLLLLRHGLRWIVDEWIEPPLWFRLIWVLVYYVGVLFILILRV
jgi:hypothetical protein